MNTQEWFADLLKKYDSFRTEGLMFEITEKMAVMQQQIEEKDKEIALQQGRDKDMEGVLAKLIREKIIALNEQITTYRFNEHFARKLEFIESANSLQKELGLLIEFKCWLVSLKLD